MLPKQISQQSGLTEPTQNSGQILGRTKQQTSRFSSLADLVHWEQPTPAKTWEITFWTAPFQKVRVAATIGRGEMTAGSQHNCRPVSRLKSQLCSKLFQNISQIVLTVPLS